MSPKRWLVLTLVVSVGMNFALVGYLAGQASAGGMAPPFADPALGAGRLLHTLPEERRRELRAHLRAHPRSHRPDVRELRRMQRDLEQTFAADPLDEAELRGTLEQFRVQLCDSMAQSHESFVVLASAMTAEERGNVNLLRPPHRRHGAPGRSGGGTHVRPEHGREQR